MSYWSRVWEQAQKHDVASQQHARWHEDHQKPYPCHACIHPRGIDVDRLHAAASALSNYIDGGALSGLRRDPRRVSRGLRSAASS
jgi:sulfur relay (sulfurtransferase) complex TusBCD TusD component (DsrE family)